MPVDDQTPGLQDSKAEMEPVVHNDFINVPNGGVLNDIRKKCQGGYGPLTLLRELLQNADDARATKACMTLQEDPEGVVWWNDGEVDTNEEVAKNDWKRLANLHDGGRSGDPDTIGAFGLGKTVLFNWGEGFIAYPGQNGPGRVTVDLGAGDKPSIRVPEPVPMPKPAKGMALWIPLRTQRIIDASPMLVIESACSLAELRESLQRQAHRVATMLPLLGYISNVELKEGERVLWTVSLRRGRRTLDPGNADQSMGTPFEGTLDIQVNGEPLIQRHYWGHQLNGPDTKPPLLPDGNPLPGWDRLLMDQRRRSQPAERHAHAAAVFITGLEGNTIHEVLRAAFLPLGEKPENPEATLLLLHANGYPDETRTKFHFPSRQQDPPTTAAEWTWNLWAKKTLPLIPGVLKASGCHPDLQTWMQVLNDKLQEEQTNLTTEAWEQVESTHRLMAVWTHERKEFDVLPVVNSELMDTVLLDSFQDIPCGPVGFRFGLKQTLTSPINLNTVTWTVGGFKALMGWCENRSAQVLNHVLQGLPPERKETLLEILSLPVKVAIADGTDGENRRQRKDVFQLMQDQARSLAKAFHCMVPYLEVNTDLSSYVPETQRGLEFAFDRLISQQKLSATWAHRQPLAACFQQSGNTRCLKSVLAGKPLTEQGPIYCLPEDQILARVADHFIQRHPGTLLSAEAMQWLRNELGEARQNAIVTKLTDHVLAEWALTPEGAKTLSPLLLGDPPAIRSWDLLKSLKIGAGTQFFNLPFFPTSNGELTALSEADVFVAPPTNLNWQWAEGFPGQTPQIICDWPMDLVIPDEKTWKRSQGLKWILENRSEHACLPTWTLRILSGGSIEQIDQPTRQALRTTAWLPNVGVNERFRPDQLLWHLNADWHQRLPQPGQSWAHKGHLAHDFSTRLEENDALTRALFPIPGTPDWTHGGQYWNGLRALVQANTGQLGIPGVFKQTPGWLDFVGEIVDPEDFPGLRFLVSLHSQHPALAEACTEDCPTIENLTNEAWRALLEAITPNTHHPEEPQRIASGIAIFLEFLHSLTEITHATFKGLKLPNALGEWRDTATLLKPDDLPADDRRGLHGDFYNCLKGSPFHWQSSHGEEILQAGDPEFLQNHGLAWVQAGHLESDGLLGLLAFATGVDHLATAHLPQVPGFQQQLQLWLHDRWTLRFNCTDQHCYALDGNSVALGGEELFLARGDDRSRSLFGKDGLENAFEALSLQNLPADWKESLRQAGTVELYASQGALLHGIHRDVTRLIAKSGTGPDNQALNDYGSLVQAYDKAAYEVFAPNLDAFERRRNETIGKLEAGIRILIENDDKPDFRNLLSDGMRSLLKEHHYESERVLLELFQNAEDAYREAKGLGFPTQNPCMFQVKVHERTLWISHHGRPINRFAWNDHQEPKFQKDLVRMCSLLDSAKHGTNGEVGHFGLGFKSVYCLTREPYILSAGRRYRIQGAIWCTAGKDGDGPFGELDPEETRIGLPLREEITPEECQGVIMSFQSFIPGLLLAANQISEIKVEGTRYKLDRIGNSECFACGGSIFWKMNSERGSLALPVFLEGEARPCRLASLPAEWPTLWALAPTCIDWKAPLFLNAPFELDSGRLSLAQESAKNIDLARKLGSTLADHVVRDLAELPDAFLRDLLVKLIYPLTQRAEVEAKAFAECTGTLWGHKEAFPTGTGIRVSVNDNLQPIVLDDLGDETKRAGALCWLQGVLDPHDFALVRNDDWDKLKPFRDQQLRTPEKCNPDDLLWPRNEKGRLEWNTLKALRQGLKRWQEYCHQYPNDLPWRLGVKLRHSVTLPTNSQEGKSLDRLRLMGGTENDDLLQDLWNGLEADEQIALRNLRGPDVSVKIDSGQCEKYRYVPVENPANWVSRVFEAWNDSGNSPDDYPVYCAPVLHAELEEIENPKYDLHWLKLFVFTAAHSVGWGTASRAHGFLEWADSKGMLQQMADHLPNQMSVGAEKAWMQLLWDQANNPNEEHDYSFRVLFAQMHRIRLKLADYRSHLLAFNQWPEGRNTPGNWLLNPTEHPYLPEHINTECMASLNRVLGPMGCIVLLRELQRLKIVSHESLVMHGFVPWGRLLRKLDRDDRLRGIEQSSWIHSSIRDALQAKNQQQVHEFLGMFDIPFQAALDGLLKNREGRCL